MSEEPTIEINDEIEETEQEESFDIEGLGKEQLALAKEHGLYVEKEEKDENDKQPEVETKEDNGTVQEEEAEQEKEINTDPDNFEEMDEVLNKDEKKFHSSFTPNQKALFFKSKADKKKRQEAQKRAQELEEEVKRLSAGKASSSKIEKIAKMLKENQDALTVEALEAVINEQETETEEGKNSFAEDAQKVQARIQEKVKFADDIGRAKFENYDNLVNLAKEVIETDKTGTFQKLINESVMSDDVDESLLVDRVIMIAKTSPKYSDVANKVAPEKKEIVDRALKNSKKKMSSAAVGSSGGKRIISESELTVDQAAKLSTKQWNNLKPETRERILRGINP